MPSPLIPQWDVELAWPPTGNGGDALRQLPAARGVFAFENAAGQTLMLAVSADVRRLVRSRLESPSAGDDDDESQPDPAIAVRRILAQFAGSEFEAEWTYLQHARRRLPHEYRLFLDRRQCFWAHADPAAAHPQWVKTAHPGRPPTGRAGVYLGPFADKHAAGRFIELLEDSFDLCRYHHILVQAPAATACAYKEMGRCPAPCDGSITMDAYRQQVRASVRFAGAGAAASVSGLEQRMREAGERHDFESAAALKVQLERAGGMSKPRFRYVRDLRELRMLGVFPSPRAERRRLFVIVGGWIAPFCDVHIDAGIDELDIVVNAVRALASKTPVSLEPEVTENLGVLAAHLFLPAKKSEGRFLRIDDSLDGRALKRAARR